MAEFLKDEDRDKLKGLHRKTKEKKLADRIKCILALDSGFTYKEIKKMLLLDEVSINNYKKIYQENGIDKLLDVNYNGYSGKLSLAQEEELKDHLKKHLIRSAKGICEIVKQRFGKKYTLSWNGSSFT
ncbi:MAG: helix-turn-helix domain-containing protein [bacterium]